MATKQVPTIKQDAGKIPAHRVTFYQDNKKPELRLESGQRAAFLYFKTDKKTNVLRSSMAVILNIVKWQECRDAEKGSEFLQSLVDEVQDSYLKRVAEGSADFDRTELADKLVADYFDTTRVGGKRVSAEMIGTYFDSSIASWLMDRVVVKFPAFDADKVAKVVMQYRTSFADLTKYSLPQSKQVAEMLQKAWNEFKESEGFEQDELAEWVGERIQKLMDRHNASEMLIDAI